MSSPEVDWVLDQWASVVTWAANNYTLDNGDSVTLKRVDRDDSQVYDGSQTVDMSTPIRSRTAELQEAVYAGARFADKTDSPVGTEFDYDREVIVGVRIEGLHHSEFGHVDPDASEGVPFSDLVNELRDAILTERVRPTGAEPAGVEYTHLTTANEAPQSAAWADYFRHDFDVVLSGYESLP